MPIYERLKTLLEDRAENPWIEALGADRSAIRGIKTLDKPPGWEVLSAIRKAERVNLPWLLEDKGTPFEVLRYVDDASCAYDLACHLGEEKWATVIATDGKRLAFVLAQPGESEVEGRAGKRTPFSYTMMEVFLGGAAESLAVIRDIGHHVRLAPIPPDQMDAIYRGKVGTWRLLLAPDAWLKNSKPISRDHPVFQSQSAEPRYLTKDEEHVLSCYLAMEPAQRETYKAIGDTLANTASGKEMKRVAK